MVVSKPSLKGVVIEEFCTSDPTKNCTKIFQEQLNKMHRLEIPNSTPIQKRKLKQQDNMETR